ncbi:amino acid permease [Enterovibrio norvegicus FF-162]|uniref:Amino acid permease n=1 Tax=Enterovibrio norvegicus FF-454 TaxID=1185651 RepID=A0A1E5C1V2_9GAMM|nr:APC family permease [Enterovibrio norvegicus]OEE59469.1 amino acid permease [Enterovibrio norvegicus FF-454]OEE86595.1 amino acid permease [Enterovibrio norvegicus FF-162]
MTDPTVSHHRHISLWGVVALGIGSMVGAGVFALLGQIAVNVRGDTWIVFVLAGIAALFSGYSYARLSAKFPSRGGVTDFFALGMGSPRIERALACLYLITLVLTLALVAKAFGAYAARVVHQPDHSDWVNLYATGIMILLTIVNLMGSKAVGRIEMFLVAIKLTILALFIGVGAVTLKPAMLEVHNDVPASLMFSSIGLAFFAYSGFGMMATAAADVTKPEKTMPRAFMIAVSVVMVLYVVLALVVLGNVAPEDLVKYTDTAVAQAAEPILGNWGFILVSLAALFATASSIVANIFSMLNVSKQMGSSGILPQIFRIQSFAGGTRGFYSLIAIVIVLTNFFDLSSIANVASATFLACYIAVFIVCWRRRKDCHANPLIISMGFVFMTAIFVTFIGEMIVEKLWLECLTLAAAALFSLLIGWRTPDIDNQQPDNANSEQQ